MTEDEFTTLKEWYVRDLLKPEIDKFERATILRSLIDDKGVSVREFARYANIPRSTLEDWLLYNRISEDEYNALVKKGINPKTIYKTLRDDKKRALEIGEIDLYLTEMRDKVRALSKKKFKITPKTQMLIDETVNELNCLHVEVNLREKKANS